MRFLRYSIIPVFALLCLALPSPAQLPSSAVHKAIADLNEQKYPEAEAILRDVLRDHPNDPTLLGFMAVALDGEKRYAEAETYFSQAIKLSPGSAALLNNLGTHYLAMGDREHARQAYLSAVRINMHDPNANLQLAQIAVKARQGAEALRYLDRLPAERLATPALSVVRAQALALAGKPELAESLLARVLAESPDDPRVAFAAGMTFADWKRYQDAEKAFTQALRSAPTNFDAQYNLGLAALGAKDLERAANAFQIALRQRPDDPDCLYNLARAYDAQGQTLRGMVPLEQAQRLAPQRPDIILLAANLSEKLGFYGDAAAAFGSYLKLRPGDNPARRERGFALAVASRTEAALRDLEEYVRRNPRDARGLYELGVVETVWNREKSLRHINAALAFDPAFLPARYARAVLYYQSGQYREALSDLQIVLAREPDDLGALDTLGETQLQLGNVQASVKALCNAAELAPDDGLILMHYSRALTRNHQPEEAQATLDKFRRLGSESNPGRPNSGLLRFLELSRPQQEAQYLANLRIRLRMNPDSVSLKVRIAQEELAQGERQQALEMFQKVLTESSDPRVLQDCASALLDNEEYEPARGLLEKVLSIEPSRTDARLDLAIAVFRTTGADAALAELSRVPPIQQKGDFFLLKAQLLEAEGKPEQAAAALNRGFEASPTRADLYFQAALFLVKHNQVQQMVDVLGRAEKIVPGDPKLMLTRAIGLEMLHEHEEALNVLSKLESQQPTWYLPYEIHGIILTTRIRPAEAKPVLQTAIALGADDPRAYFYLASGIIQANTEDVSEAQKAIDQAVALDPKDPFIQSLAGRIAYLGKDYPSALKHLQTALTIWPDMIEAHQILSGTYRALGEKDKSIEELKTVLRIKQQNPDADQSPPSSLGNLLFAVRPPSGQDSNY